MQPINRSGIMDNITLIPTHQENNHINYIDAMRGLAMFMVVVDHIFTICTLTNNPINILINGQFQLPLFFFISGFFINHSCSKPFLPTIWDKFRRLIIPAIVVMSLYIWIIDADYYTVITHYLKYGYWFTFVLFGFTLIYIMFDKLISFVMNKTWHDTFIIISALFVIFLSSYMTHHSQLHTVMSMFNIEQYQLYIYFVLGSICFQYKDNIFNLMNNNLIFGLLMTGFIIMEILLHKYGVLFMKGYIFWDSITVFIGLLIIWKCFHTYTGLCKDNIFGKFLSLIGRRSLDVYLFHYFILRQALGSWGVLDNAFLQYLLAIVLATIIVLGSLGMGYIIRLSPIMSEFMLGILKKQSDKKSVA